MKVTVIGVNGLAGSAFARILPPLGHECIGVTRHNYEKLKNTKTDILINANGGTSKPKAESDPIGEIDRTVITAMQFCRDFKFDQFVQISSGDVYSVLDDPEQNTEDTEIILDDLSAYGICKFLAESAVRKQCDKWLIVRPGGLLGPGLRKNPIFDLLTGDKLYVHPDSRFGYIHTDKLAWIIITLLEKNISNDVFNVCGKGLVSIRQVMEWTDNESASYDDSREPSHYELNHDKIEQHCELPDSETTVRNFIEWWRKENRDA